MATLSEKSVPPHWQYYLDAPPPENTNPIEQYLYQVIDEIKKNPHKIGVRHHKVFYRAQQRAGGYVDVAWISLVGRWIRRLGFQIGCYTHVFSANGVIVICLDKKHEKEMQLKAQQAAEAEKKRLKRKGLSTPPD